MAKWVLAFFCFPMCAQTPADWKTVLERLDKLEQENRELREQVKSLRDKISPPVEATPAEKPEPSLEERVAVQEQRTAEQADTKVEAAQRFPIKLSGMVLFNAFYGTRNSAGQDIVLTAAPSPGSNAAGGTFRQSVLGLEYRGPATVWGGHVSSSIFLDFFSTSDDGYSVARVRTANIELNWKSRSVAFGLEKPLFSPRDPTSLAQVGISPLTAAGNLWRWQPQIRFEQRVNLGKATQLRAQAGIIQTSEAIGYSGDFTPPSLEARRPGVEGRFELSHHFDETRRVEIAPGFHYSTTHVVGMSIPSQLVSFDWFANPWWSKLELTGAFFKGENIAHFGGLRQGFQIDNNNRALPVHATGGWAQLAFQAMPRLSFHAMAGVHDDRNSDLSYYQRIGQNRIGAANVMFRVAPNVIWSFEAEQVRTDYLLGTGWRLVNRYDMSMAYQF
jgi:hypothetical protein